MISIDKAANWIPKLSKALIGKRDNRNKEIAAVAKELMFSPHDLAPLFIEPDLQLFNPADDTNFEDEMFRVPLYKFINGFITENKVNEDGRRHLFIIGDAGMGKTSALAMLKLAHIKKFFPAKHSYVAIKLGPDTIERIKSIEDPHNTLLLLDSLDEDQEAYFRTDQRILEILETTKTFFRVIITCRTQFFPKTSDPIFQRQDRVKIGGFTCPVKYLSLFNDKQIDEYFEKKYFNDINKIEEAKTLVDKMDDLQCRPLILSYIDDFIDHKEILNKFKIYNYIINAWIDRECRKEGVTYTADELLNTCKKIACYMTENNSRTIAEKTLATRVYIGKKYSPKKMLDNLGLVVVGGRTLLNRNSDGEFLFAHKSFQEFLVVLTLIDNWGWSFPSSSEVMHSFMLEADLTNKNLRGAKLESACLISIDLSNSDLFGSDLSQSMLNKSHLFRTNLQESCMISANMCMATLEKTDFSGAQIQNANLQNTCVTRVNFDRANLNSSLFCDSLIDDSSFDCTSLDRVNFQGCTLRKLNLQGQKMINCNLSETKIEGTNMDAIDLTNANLEAAFFYKVSLKGANLSGAKLDKATFEDVELEGAIFDQSSIDKVVFKNSNYKDAVIK